MKKIISRAVTYIIFCLIAFSASAQYSTNFKVTGVKDENLQSKIDLAVSNLLTAFNEAQGRMEVPTIPEAQVTPEVEQIIMKLWEDCPFRCADTEVVEACTKSANGEFQVRNIPLIMMPRDPADASWKKYQEGVFTFNKNGVVTNFHLAINADLYIKVMRSTDVVDDIVQRELILEYVERFRNAYNLKDLPFLQQVFSDDALIITGKVIKTVKSDINRLNSNNKKIVYSRQSKKEYLTKLERIFKQNKHINVNFDDIKMVKHPAKANFYGVTLKQEYSSSIYSDVGYLFLLWDFTNPDAPQIHVRTWQPDKIDNIALPEDEIFNVDDFDL